MYEADHTLMFLLRKKVFNCVLAEDTDYALTGIDLNILRGLKWCVLLVLCDQHAAQGS